jgi:hypothetical protein
VVSKALNGKTTAVARATEALLSLVELEQGEKVMVRMRDIMLFLSRRSWNLISLTAIPLDPFDHLR